MMDRERADAAEADALRRQIVEAVAANGGHLAAALGVVELAIALRRTFSPPSDKVLWDVGHQAYAWKLLTGRAEGFKRLRRIDGVSGFPWPDESPCDAFVAGHAGSALAAAFGLAAGFQVKAKGESPHIVAVVGDASLANGESLEALSAARSLDGKVIVVVNDNAAEGAWHPDGAFFGAFGIRSLGPVDGHDVEAVSAALEAAKREDRTVAVHVVTKKGKGFAPAEEDPVAWHSVGPFKFRVQSSEFRVQSSELDDALENVNSKLETQNSKLQTPIWSAVFGEAMCEAAHRDEKVCAVVAAMGHGTGLDGFAREFPERFFDVGIREEMAVTFAAGLAKAGLKPVVAIYSTFLQRAVDQIQHDVCLQRLPVVFAVDRAGCVGEDGATHHGLYDIPLLRPLTGMRILAPCCADDLKEMLASALAGDGPVAIRYPKGVAPATLNPQPTTQNSKLKTLNSKLLLCAVGDQVAKAKAVKELLAAAGVEAVVIPVRDVKPPAIMREQVKGLLVTLENGVVVGGFGESIGADMRFGWPDAVVGHGPVEALEREFGFDAASVARTILERMGVKHG